MALGTIMEVLEVAEVCKKGRGGLDEGTFREGWRRLRAPGGALHNGRVLLAGLDQDCLVDSLFDRGQGADAIGFWSFAVGTGTTPARTVRRLILRPSDSKWWGAEPFAEMEARFGEEPGRNA
jgi:hypothetical protein